MSNKHLNLNSSLVESSVHYWIVNRVRFSVLKLDCGDNEDTVRVFTFDTGSKLSSIITGASAHVDCNFYEVVLLE